MTVTYSETSRVVFDKAEILLNTGGWWTIHTKVHLNQVSRRFKLRYRILVKKDKWYVTYQGKTHEFTAVQIKLNRVSGHVTPTT
jgi:hypothetical protein